MKRNLTVCVFCGASPKVHARYLELARRVGTTLARHGCTVMYGGANGGLMGALADAALAGQARVIGVIPTTLRGRELAHNHLSELVEVETMAIRKEIMFARSDAFLALPGGFGTLDELFEVLTLRQIGEHTKRVGLLEYEGFWSPLLQWVHRAVDEQFVPETVSGAIEKIEDVHALGSWLDTLAV
jgi:uncharacterized protein (TIGR00730 family)